MEADLAATKRYVQLRDGCKIVVHDFGGFGHPLLILHANGFHAFTYLPMINILQEEFHCIGVDLRASGDSSRGTVDLDPEEFALDLQEIVQSLNLRGCYAFGHSLGGTSALLAHAANPALFKALYVYEGVIMSSEHSYEGKDSPEVSHLSMVQDLHASPILGSIDTSVPRPNLGKIALRRKNKFYSVEEAKSHLGAKPPFSIFDPGAFDGYVRHGLKNIEGEEALSWKCDPKHEADIFRSFVGVTLDLRRISCPVMIARGSESVPPHDLLHKSSGFMAEYIRSARLTEFEGLGHLGPLEDPVTVALSIQEYFLHSMAQEFPSTCQSKL